MTGDIALIGFEWANERLRAWSFDADGEIVSELEVALAAGAGEKSAADQVRQRIQSGLGSPACVPFIGCGDLAAHCTGSNDGALPVPLDISALSERLRYIHGLYVVPWLRQVSPPDLSCGSETLLASLEEPHGRVCCVNRQARHYTLQNGRATKFCTELTPDLYRLLLNAEAFYGVSVEGRSDPDSDIFRDWVDRALDSDEPASAFSVHAAIQSGVLAKADGASALLGLLVGADIAKHYDPGDEVTLLAGRDWLGAYTQAFQVLGADVEAVSADEALQDGLFDLADMAGLLAGG